MGRRLILTVVAIAVTAGLLGPLLLAGVFVADFWRARSAELFVRAALDDLNSGRLPALSRNMTEDQRAEVESLSGTDFGPYQLDNWEVEYGDIYRYIITTEDGGRFACAVEPAENGGFVLRLLREKTEEKNGGQGSLLKNSPIYPV